MEKEEEEDNIFTPWTSVYEDQEPAEGDEEEGEERGEEEEGETEEQAQRKSSVDIPRPSRASTTRRASLPCLTQLHAMNLSHLHSSTMAPSPAHLKHRTQSDARPYQRSRQRSLNEEGSGASTPSTISQRRPSAIPTIPEGIETLERRIRFRSRNVMSMSDADSICLICHDDLRKGGGGVRELHCTHSFHSECIEEWLWTKQSCPTCRVHIAMPEPLYWTSTRVKVP